MFLRRGGQLDRRYAARKAGRWSSRKSRHKRGGKTYPDYSHRHDVAPI
jgi:hypothetical protein